MPYRPGMMNMTGCAEAKEQLTAMLAAHRMSHIAESRSRTVKQPYFHAVFTGNPGCAKTTCARLYARALAQEGITKHDRFAELAKEYDAVFHVNIGSGFSASHQNAVLAAENLPNVYVIDSRNLSTGQGHVVLEACRLAKTATDPEEMYRQLNAFAPTVDASFLLDRLDYMVKGGRCSSVVALGANLLRLKPCIEVVDNKMIVGKSTAAAMSSAWSTMSATVWRTATTCCTTRSSSRTRPSRRRSSTPCTAPCASAVISSIFMRQTRAARSRATAARARSACCTCTSPRTDIRTYIL